MSRQSNLDQPLPLAVQQFLTNLQESESVFRHAPATYCFKGWLRSNDQLRAILRCKMEYLQGNAIQINKTVRFLIIMDQDGMLIDFQRINNKERIKKLQGQIK